jgi:hypothetical protein
VWQTHRHHWLEPWRGRELRLSPDIACRIDLRSRVNLNGPRATSQYGNEDEQPELHESIVDRRYATCVSQVPVRYPPVHLDRRGITLTRKPWHGLQSQLLPDETRVESATSERGQSGRIIPIWAVLSRAIRLMPPSGKSHALACYQ